MRPLLLITLIAACASPARVPRPPMGVDDHLTEAERHEADARLLEDRAAAAERAGSSTQPVCGDQAVADQVTSGGERLGIRAPCWRGEAGAVARDRATAARLLADARAHRAQARRMVTAARWWCAGLPPEELDHTPFDHREDIAAVSAELDGERVRGARIRFNAVPGLTADWLRQTLTCHAAIAEAAGHDPTHLATCPSVVAGATTTVIDDPAGLIVIVRADDPAAALTVYGRAEALLDRQLDVHGEHGDAEH